MSEESLSPVVVKRAKRPKNVRDAPWVRTGQGAKGEVDKKKLLKMITTFTTDIIKKLGKGRRESVYQLALKTCLTDEYLGIPISIEHPVPIMYNSEKVGIGYLDIVVFGMFFVEVKAVGKVSEKDILQTMAYSKDMGLVGFLINFVQKVNTHKNNIDIYLIQEGSIVSHCSV